MSQRRSQRPPSAASPALPNLPPQPRPDPSFLAPLRPHSTAGPQGPVPPTGPAPPRRASSKRPLSPALPAC